MLKGTDRSYTFKKQLNIVYRSNDIHRFIISLCSSNLYVLFADVRISHRY